MLPRAKSHTPCSSSVRYAWLSKCRMPGPLRVLEQLHEEERRLRIFAAEAKVLIEAARLLAVEIDVKELPRLERLRDAVREVEPRHRVVRDFGVEADHVRVVERVDEREHVADRSAGRCRRAAR